MKKGWKRWLDRVKETTYRRNCSHCSTVRRHTWHSRSGHRYPPFLPLWEDSKEEVVLYGWWNSRRTQVDRCLRHSRGLGSGCCSWGRNGRWNYSSGSNILVCWGQEARRRRDMRHRLRRGRRRRCWGRWRCRKECWLIVTEGGMMRVTQLEIMEQVGMHSWSLGRRIAFGMSLGRTRRDQCRTIGEEKLNMGIHEYLRR